MKKMENISVIGLGAIGAAYAAKLHDMNPQSVRVIAEETRIRRYQAEGVTINGRPYRFRYIAPEERTEPADLILVAVKYDGLTQAIKHMRHHVGPDTIIISLMNGISSEDIIASEYGAKNILYAMCVAIDAVRTGTSVHYSSFGRICFGEKTNTVRSAKVLAVQELFERANIPYEIPQNMEHALWWKFMINVGVNQTSAVLKAPYGVFQQLEEARLLMNQTMREVIVLSQKTGVDLSEDDLRKFSPILMAMSPDGKTSMLQDIEAGRKTEVEYFAGTVCELGRKYGVPTPYNDMLFNMVRVLEKTGK